MSENHAYLNIQWRELITSTPDRKLAFIYNTKKYMRNPGTIIPDLNNAIFWQDRPDLAGKLWPRPARTFTYPAYSSNQSSWQHFHCLYVMSTSHLPVSCRVYKRRRFVSWLCIRYAHSGAAADNFIARSVMLLFHLQLKDILLLIVFFALSALWRRESSRITAAAAVPLLIQNQYCKSFLIRHHLRSKGCGKWRRRLFQYKSRERFRTLNDL